MRSALAIALFVFSTSSFAAARPEREDILIADFEGPDYGDWKVEGEAFGPGPARGTLPNQMAVTGYKGKGLVNSYYGGDRTTGKLISPPFRIERRWIAFLIGGGGYPGKTCINLIHKGKVVRTATGPNTGGGGSEALEPYAWDVGDLMGETVHIEIVDAHTGGWGHINVDHIVQTDKKPEIAERPGRHTRKLRLDKHYLLIPIRNGAKMARVDLVIEGRAVRQFDAELARSENEMSFWAFLDLTPFRGREGEIVAENSYKESLELLRLSDTLPEPENLYDEPLRPQFHFSQRVGWNNDPNGCVYYDGEWHLYFQHNPYGWRWGNMHWGHAVSPDLVHWEQLPIAIYPPRRGDWAFSGSAVVDHENTSGWQKGKEKVIVAFWTSTGRGECVAYSNDRGRTFTEYEGNPVVRHTGRDPKVIWYAPGKHWVMAVYDRHENKNGIAFYTSRDLKKWEFQSRIYGYYECPEIFELPVDGDAKNTRWVVFAADARYAIGDFDGKRFTPHHEGKHRVHYGAYYASQCFNNAPDGRVIQIGWARINMPGMPFNQTFTFPHRLTLRTTPEGIRMFARPVREIEKLYRTTREFRAADLAPGKSATLPVSGELFDIEAAFEVREAAAVGIDIGGEIIRYDAKAKKLGEAPLAPEDGKITIRVLVDRPMLETIGNRGRVYITSPRRKHGPPGAVRAFVEGGPAKLLRLEVRELASIWKKKK